MFHVHSCWSQATIFPLESTPARNENADGGYCGDHACSCCHIHCKPDRFSDLLGEERRRRGSVIGAEATVGARALFSHEAHARRRNSRRRCNRSLCAERTWVPDGTVTSLFRKSATAHDGPSMPCILSG